MTHPCPFGYDLPGARSFPGPHQHSPATPPAARPTDNACVCGPEPANPEDHSTRIFALSTTSAQRTIIARI